MVDDGDVVDDVKFEKLNKLIKNVDDDATGDDGEDAEGEKGDPNNGLLLFCNWTSQSLDDSLCESSIVIPDNSSWDTFDTDDTDDDSNDDDGDEAESDLVKFINNFLARGKYEFDD